MNIERKIVETRPGSWNWMSKPVKAMIEMIRPITSVPAVEPSDTPLIAIRPSG